MFELSWKRASNLLRKCRSERACNVAFVVIGYVLLSFIGGVAVILWGIV